jgi:site-specific DNA recombinase
MSEKKKIATYARVSVIVQSEEGKSLDAQKAEMHEFAEARNWEVVAEFVDAGKTGTNTDRSGLQVMLKAAEDGAFDVLLVHDLSRLSRSLSDTLEIFRDLGEMDVGFASVNDPDFDFSNATGRLFLSIIAALNQYYVDVLKMHTAKSKRERARRGLYNAPTTPYGYRRVGDADTPPEIVEKEAEVVRELFARYATGEYSYLDLVSWINNAGHRTQTGRNFSRNTIANMLCNPFYKGAVAYKKGERSLDAGEVYDGQHEAIVSEGVWEAVRKIREQKSNDISKTPRSNHVYMINKFVHCDVCKRKLNAYWRNPRGYYREVSQIRGFIDCPISGISTRSKNVERQIGAIFRRIELPDDWREELEEMIEPDKEPERLKRRRARLVAKRKRLKKWRIKGMYDDDPELFDQKLAQVRQKIAALPEPVELEAMEKAAQTVKNLTELWDDAEKEDRKKLLRAAIERITVDVPQGRLVTIEPYLVFVPLLRKVSLLQEIDLGVFSPVWTEALVEELDVMPIADAVTQMPSTAETPDWPLVLDMPKGMKGKFVTPLLSDWLSSRRQSGEALGPVVALKNPHLEPLKAHRRYWDTQIERVNNLANRPGESVAFLWTPFALQRRKTKQDLIADAQRLLEEGGQWVLVDVLPSSMRVHWLYRYFPQAWETDRKQTWNAYDLYNNLRKADFEVELERRSIYRPVAVNVALKIARDRERCPQLASLPDAVYEEGIQRLKAVLERKGDDHLLPSEVCLTIVTVEKQSQVDGF